MFLVVTVYTLGSKLLKFDNLQYNTLVRWADGTNNSSTKRLTCQVYFFLISYRLRALKTLYIHFCNLKKKIKKIKKINWEGFCKEFFKILWKKNALNIRRLVHDLFVPSAQRTSVLFYRLTNFYICRCLPKCWLKWSSFILNG